MEIAVFENKLIGILRGFSDEDALFAARTAVLCGVDIFEVAIRKGHERDDGKALFALKRSLPDSVLVGAGTVLDLPTLNAVQKCGADFIVSPGVISDVAALCVSRGLPCIPGAFTPTEICSAYALGAFMVKLFPADALGPSYIRAVKTPLAHIHIAAMGGITPENIIEYKKAGVTSYGISSGLFKPQEVCGRDEKAVIRRVESYINALSQ